MGTIFPTTIKQLKLFTRPRWRRGWTKRKSYLTLRKIWVTRLTYGKISTGPGNHATSTRCTLGTNGTNTIKRISKLAFQTPPLASSELTIAITVIPITRRPRWFKAIKLPYFCASCWVLIYFVILSAARDSRPDLIDKTKAPSFNVIKEKGNDDTALLVFKCGPPYEDLAFRIVNREWEYALTLLFFA